MSAAEIETLLKYPAVLLAGFLATFVLAPVVGRLAGAIGMMDVPDARRIHKAPVPRAGLAVFLGFHVACAVIHLPPWIPFVGSLDSYWWISMLLLSGILLLVGMADDIWNLRPFAKLAGQLLVAVLAYAMDMRVGRVLGMDLNPVLDIAFTVFWYLAIINAFNLIDGLDGLASGLAAIAALGLATSFMFRHVPRDALVMLGLLGACMGFLRYNFHPARMFLGDSGSMFLGFVLASAALCTGSKGTAVASIGVPLLALGVPLIDTALAVWRRGARAARARGSETDRTDGIFGADLEHVHHRLLRTGLSQRAVASVLCGLAALLVAVGLLSMVYRSRALGIYLLAFVAAAYVIVRHLAQVELWDSGVLLTNGLRRPRSRVMATLLYPPLDALVLAFSLFVAAWLTNPDQLLEGMRQYWFDRLPLWVGLPFLFLFFARTYGRVWSRARVSEYVILVAALLSGILAATGIAIMSGQMDPSVKYTLMQVEHVPDLTVAMVQNVPGTLAQQVVIFAGIAITLIAGVRALPRALQDAMGWAYILRDRDERETTNVLVYGARYGCTLYLLEQSFRRIDEKQGIRMCGLIDDDPNLRGRYVHGCRVLGGIEAVAETIDKMKIDEIIVTEALASAVTETLIDLGRSKGVRISRWKTTRDILESIGS